MIRLLLVIILAAPLGACSVPGPVEYAGPPADAPTWALNPGMWQQNTNTLITSPPYAGVVGETPHVRR